MRIQLRPCAVIVLLALAWAPAAGAEEFYVRIEFLLGRRGAWEPGPLNPIASLYPNSALVPARQPAGASEDVHFNPDTDLASIYQLSHVYAMADSILRWDEASGPFPGLLVFEREIFRLDLQPRIIGPNRMKLRLIVSRIRNQRRGPAKVLDTELVAGLDDPVVAGFAHAGQPYFVSILVTKARPEGRAGEAGRPSGEAMTPVPIRRVDPKIPESVDPAGLEGEVVLRVTLDESGKATDIQVLKSLQLDMDRETVKAVREWTFEPIRRTGGRGPATFVMSFRFRPSGGGKVAKRDKPVEAETTHRAIARGASSPRHIPAPIGEAAAEANPQVNGR